MIRLVLIFLIVFLGFLYNTTLFSSNRDVRRKKFIILVCILLSFQSGLRHVYVGPDTFQYWLRFEDVKKYAFKDLWENFLNFKIKDPFYDVFEKIFQFFSEDYQVYLMFVAIIFMSALGSFVYKNTFTVKQSMLAFIIYMGYYYGFYSITGIRQTLATAVILFSVQFIKNSKFLWFLLLVIFASLFHISALIFIPAYFVAKIKNSKRLLLIGLLLFPISLSYKDFIIIKIISILGVEDRFGQYAEQTGLSGSVILTTFQVILAFLAFLKINSVKNIIPNSALIANIFAIGFILLPLQWVNPNAGRISQYYSQFLMILIPYLLDAFSSRPKIRNTLYIFSVIIFTIITTFAIRKDKEYNFFWQRMERPKY